MFSRISADETTWDEFVLRHGGEFLQSWGWAAFQEKLGKKVFRYRVDESENGGAATVGQFVMMLERLPFGQRYAYVPRGPVLRSRADLDSAIEAIRAAVRDHDCAFARVEPPLGLTGRDLELHRFEPGAHVQPPDTSIIDLRKPEEELLAAMHQKTRYNIKIAGKHGVTVREARGDNAHEFQKDIDLFWGLLGHTAERDRFHTHSREYYATMLDVLSGRKMHGLRVRLVFAEHEGKAVAGLLAAEFGKTVTYLHGASSSENRQVMAPFALHWEVMKEAKARGFEAYDLWGVAPTDDPEHRWAGITRFKMGFGGPRIAYPGAWELPGKPIWYRLYRAAKKLR